MFASVLMLHATFSVFQTLFVFSVLNVNYSPIT